MSVHDLDKSDQLSSLFSDKKETQYSRTMLYVSIGGKYNEPAVFFHHPEMIKNHAISTNAIKQMVPSFLLCRSMTTRIIILVIDNFSDPTNKAVNKKLISNRLCSNMEAVLINQDLTKNNICPLIESICRIGIDLQVDADDFMICNYIKFKNEPRRAEAELEEWLPTLTQSVLNRPEFSIYIDCLYEWFGYRFYLFNFIYRWRLSTMLFMNYRKISLQFERFLRDRPFDIMYDSDIVKMTKKTHFWGCVYDITSTTNDSENVGKMALSMKEYIEESFSD
jgi:hypothetical protein